MNPLFLLLILVWGSSLMTILIAAVLYANVDHVWSWLETYMTPTAFKKLNYLRDRSQQVVDRLSQTYLQDVKRLFQYRPRRHSNDEGK